MENFNIEKTPHVGIGKDRAVGRIRRREVDEILNKNYKRDDLVISREREYFITERETRAALRRQNQPLWQYEAEKLPDQQREKFRTMLEEVINREEKTEIEVAQEEAQKINEDVDELIAEMKAENRTQANAMVMERKEYRSEEHNV